MGKKLFLLLTGVMIIAAMAVFSGGEEIIRLLHGVSPHTIVVLCLLQLLTLLLTSYQWFFLLKKQCREIPFGNVWLVFLAGNFVESVTPSVKMGGEAARIFLFRQSTSLEYSKLAGMMLVQKYIILLPFLLLCSLVLAASSLLVELPTAAYAAFIFLALLVALLFKVTRGNSSCDGEKNVLPEKENKNMKGFPGFLEPFSGYKEKTSAFIMKTRKFLNKAARASRRTVTGKEKLFLMFISLLVWILYPVKVLIVADMLGFSVGIIPLASAVFTAYMVSMVPLLPGGLGSFEGSMALLLTGMGLTPAEGLAVALVARSITYWFPLLLSAGASTYLAWNQRIRFTAVENS